MYICLKEENMSAKVRVRFAPSPTGPLHIGGVRTALFNYLFAKKHNGDFILRIEDTDQSRYVEGAEEYVTKALNWCNLPFDEGPGKEKGFGPYRQSERKHLYRKYAEELIETDQAYYAFDTSENLSKLRKEYEEKGETFIYNWHNRENLDNSINLSDKQVKERLDKDTPYVIRFKSPANIDLNLSDEIRGEMKINTSVLDDKVLFKSDGMPTYHLANIVDDHLMQISHVIRGEEWLPSLPLHVLLYKAFGWDLPKFAHLPLILKPKGKGKLSKRDGDKMGFPVFPLQWKDPESGETSTGYKEEGYFPEAVVNILAHLGWNEGDGSEKEIYSLDELKKAFSLEHVSKGGSKFDPEKAKWIQHQYLQQATVEKLTQDFQQLLETKKVSTNKSYIEQVVAVLQERATFVSDFWNLGSYFFQAPLSHDEKAMKKAWREDTNDLMRGLISKLETIEDYKSEIIQTQVKQWIKEKEIAMGKVMQAFRLSLVGSMQGPDVFSISALLGKDETISRINYAIEKNS